MKKNIYIYLVICAGLLFTTCEKSGKDDFSGREKLTGRLAYQDIFAGNTVIIPLAGKAVKLAYLPTDTSNFIVCDTTDTQGYFQFDNVEKKQYAVFYEDLINGVYYLAYATPTAPDSEVKLLATSNMVKQNGLLIETTLNGQPAGGIQHCIFTNRTTFVTDTCTNSSLSGKTDSVGRKVYYNVNPTGYYIRAYKSLGKDYYSAVDSPVVVGQVGMKRVVLNLVKSEAENELVVKVSDRAGLPVAGIRVGIYNSQTKFDVDTSIVAASFTENTGADGSARFHNLRPAGIYYARARMTIGAVVLKGSGNATIGATGSFDLPVKLD